MRVDEITGEVLSGENYFCPYCDGELMDDYDYCEKCGEYVGIIVNDYSYTRNSINHSKSSYSSEKDDDKYKIEKTCCGMCFLIIILIWILSIFTHHPNI